MAFPALFQHESGFCHYSATELESTSNLCMEAAIIYKSQLQSFVLLKYTGVQFIGYTYYNFELIKINVYY